jgi:hypothetical protein
VIAGDPQHARAAASARDAAAMPLRRRHVTTTSRE